MLPAQIADELAVSDPTPETVTSACWDELPHVAVIVAVPENVADGVTVAVVDPSAPTKQLAHVTPGGYATVQVGLQLGKLSLVGEAVIVEVPPGHIAGLFTVTLCTPTTGIL